MREDPSLEEGVVVLLVVLVVVLMLVLVLLWHVVLETGPRSRAFLMSPSSRSRAASRLERQ